MRLNIVLGLIVVLLVTALVSAANLDNRQRCGEIAESMRLAEKNPLALTGKDIYYYKRHCQ